MKRTIILIAFIAICISTMMSCSKEDAYSQQEIEQKIIGKWKMISENGEDCATNYREVRTYAENGTGTRSIAALPDVKIGFLWDKKTPFQYSVSDNEVCICHNNSSHILYSRVTQICETSLSQYFYKVAMGDEVSELSSNCVYNKVSTDFSNAIIGLWEGVEMTGEETYGNADARIEYRSDGTYAYYSKAGGNWVKSTNVDNEYNVDGDWLATRWRPAPGQDFNYEWWDIVSISDTQMNWSALRERGDGSRYTSTFTWKKVS